MCERIEELVEGVRAFVVALEGSTVPGARAAELVELFSRLDKLAVGGRAFALARVAETRAWFGSGAPNLAAWTAVRAGSTINQAVNALQTAERLVDLPATRRAMANGMLSEIQSVEISAAALADPSSEDALLSLASHASVGALKEKCRDVIAASVGDEDVSERIRRTRYLRHWTDRDGALRLDARLAPEDGAPLIAVIDARTDRLIDEARRAGLREPGEAHAADALCSLIDGAGAPKTVVNVLVSESSLERGHTIAGESCRIPGIGPITVGAAQRLASGGVVRTIESDGVDVRRVSHHRRAISSYLRSALEVRDPVCVVPDCNRSRGLEIDHIVPFGRGGRTELANLARLCHAHHAAKTHHGWILSGSPGAWEWTRDHRGAKRRE